MTRDDVALALGSAASEGWNPRLHDAEAFLAADPHGFFVLKVDHEPVATVSAVRYQRATGPSPIQQFRGDEVGGRQHSVCFRRL